MAVDGHLVEVAAVVGHRAAVAIRVATAVGHREEVATAVGHQEVNLPLNTKNMYIFLKFPINDKSLLYYLLCRRQRWRLGEWLGLN